jgi:hypothetical protein
MKSYNGSGVFVHNCGTIKHLDPAITVVVWVLDLSKSVDDGDIDDDESSFDPTDNESVEFLIGAFSGVTNGKLADEYTCTCSLNYAITNNTNIS